MRKRHLNTYFVPGFLVLFFWVINSPLLAGGAAGPIIHIDPITHTFPSAFEGETLSHDFMVANRGSADLEIEDVTHQWGCVVTRYDRVIPPGGKGTVTLTVDTSRVIGEFQKRAVVWSNDSERRSIALYLNGVVTPFISLEPGGYVGLWGVKGQVPVESIEIINNHSEPVIITGIENELPQNVRWNLEETKAGFHYRLEVEDISAKAGEYTGHLIVRTDHPQKPQFVIIVNGYITE